MPDSLSAEIAGQLSGLMAAKTGGMVSRLFPSTREAAAAGQVQRMLGNRLVAPASLQLRSRRRLTLARTFQDLLHR